MTLPAQGFLRANRVEAGALHLEQPAFDLRAPAVQAAARLRPPAQDKGLTLDLELGAGLPALVSGDSVRERLFPPFSLADSSTTRRFAGTGLALAISRRLVELMGGRIGVGSTPGAGFRFWFELPLRCVAGAPALVAAYSAAARGAGVRLRVLVVEDTPVNLIVVEAMLDRLGVALERARALRRLNCGLRRHAQRACRSRAIVICRCRGPAV